MKFELEVDDVEGTMMYKINAPFKQTAFMTWEELGEWINAYYKRNKCRNADLHEQKEKNGNN